MKYDIVYILKEDINSEELRYSLRSVCKNFEYNKIWFYCGCPDDIKPDFHVPFEQTGKNKLEMVRSTYEAIANNDEITEDFWLFNDDFFILKPYNQNIPKVNGTLEQLAYDIKQRMGKDSYYTQAIRSTASVLRSKGYDTLSYACHVPMLLNRHKVKEVLQEFAPSVTFRSAYGNYVKVGGELIDDVKITNFNELPGEDWVLLSTREDSFANGQVGTYIKLKFAEPCKYELNFEEWVEKIRNLKKD